MKMKITATAVAGVMALAMLTASTAESFAAKGQGGGTTHGGGNQAGQQYGSGSPTPTIRPNATVKQALSDALNGGDGIDHGDPIQGSN